MLHGQSLDNIPNQRQLINRAGRDVLALVDPIETKRSQNFTNPVHDDVYNYALPSDFKKLIDIRPQINRTVEDNPSGRAFQEFDIRKDLEDDILSIDSNNGTKFLRYSKDIKSDGIVVNEMNSLTLNGTWTADATDATNLTVDTQNYVSGGASLNFDLSGAGTTGYIENSTMSTVDLSDHEDKSNLFLWVYFPDTSIITNVILRWGNDTSNYWSRTATTQYDGTAFKNGWNLVSFAWNGATETGTGDSENIDYARVTITYDGTADTDIRVDNIFSSIGEIYEIVYYSKYLFQNSSGTWLENHTADTDVVNLDTDSYNILLNYVAYLASQVSQGEDSVFDEGYFRNILWGTNQQVGLIPKYKVNHPSEEVRVRRTYYRIR